MKNIAVLIPGFTIEYSIDILNGIYDYFENKDARVIIAHTKYPHSTVSAFDYQYWSSSKYMQAKDIDGYIIVSGLYNSIITDEQFFDFVSSFGNRPIVSIGKDVDLPNVYTICSECNQAILDVVRHLKEEHGCKKIAFCSANSTNSEEALARYDAFTNALDELGLPFYPEFVMDGVFTDFRAEEVLLQRYKSKEEIEFDSVVCANDNMAAGVIRALDKLGVKIPEEIKVTGFDDAVVSRITTPKLSTINQNIRMQGYNASELIMKLVEKKDCPKRNIVPLQLKLRQSCGCIERSNLLPVYRNIKGKIENDLSVGVQTANQFFTEMNERNNIITLMDTLKCSNTLKQFFFNLRFVAQQCNTPEIYISFFNDVMYFYSEDEIEIPDSLELTMFCDLDTNSDNFKPGVVYNPKEKFFVTRNLREKSGIYMIHPIFSGGNNYGLLFTRIQNRRFADYLVHLRIVVNSIAQSFDYTSQITQAEILETANTDLRKQSRTDELTQILNRRGFIEQGQSALDLMQETDKAGVVFFADMDGLKFINDHYGHEMGDLAIKLMASVVKQAFRSTDIVGRLSGDEFGVVAVGMNLNQVEKVRLKINFLTEQVSKDNNLPFTLSISMGAVDLQKSSAIKKLLSEADKALYEEKRLKRNARLSQNIK